MRKLLLVIVTISSVLLTSHAQNKTPTLTLIKAGRLIDVRAGRVLQNQGILVEGERIKAVGPLAEVQRNVPNRTAVIDLSRATVLPGLADCHTHILLQGDITAADYRTVLKESSLRASGRQWRSH